MNGLEPTCKAIAFRDVTNLCLRDGKVIEQRRLSIYLTKLPEVRCNSSDDLKLLADLLS